MIFSPSSSFDFMINKGDGYYTNNYNIIFATKEKVVCY